MRRFILTGAPGSGKTSILNHFLSNGLAVAAEAATDVIADEQDRGIAEPWLDPSFIDKILEVQRARELAPVGPGVLVQFFDRSPVCTLALARYLGYSQSRLLSSEIARIISAGVYERKVFFVRPLGWVEPTAARRISYAESLEFERVHEVAYRELGFHLVDIPAVAVPLRASLVARHAGHLPVGSGLGLVPRCLLSFAVGG
jgi:predicted ATPase